jgi:hypothetical protein
VEFVHTLRAPKIINGTPQMGTEKRRDGTEYQDYVKDFVSRPLCTGDYQTLVDTGIDAEHCAMCRESKDHPEWVPGPTRRYAMHVIKYKTKPGGFTLATPFSVELVVWGFTDNLFNSIVDFKAEWGDLRQHDLLLGPCTNETFQKFEVNVGAKAEWMENDERKKLTVETFKNNQIEDLSIACGSKKEPRWLEEDLTKIKLAWQIAERSNLKPGTLGQSAESTSLAEDLSSLLQAAEPGGTAPEKPQNGAVATSGNPELDALLADTESKPEAPAKPDSWTSADTPAPASQAEADADAAASEAPAAESLNFEDLLADLDNK